MLDKSNIMYVGDFVGIFVNRQAGLNKCIMHSNGLNCVLFWFYCLFLLYNSFIEGRHILSLSQRLKVSYCDHWMSDINNCFKGHLNNWLDFDQHHLL